MSIQGPAISKSRRKSSNSSAAVPSVGPRDVLFVIFKHLPKALAVFLSIMAVTLLIALFWPSKYRSEAKVRVGIGLEDIAPNPAARTMGQIMPVSIRPESSVNSEAETLKSRQVIEKVVDQIGGKPFLGREFSADPTGLANDRARSMIKLAGDLDVRTEPLSNIIQVTYENKSDVAAKEVLESYLKAYQEYRSSLNTNPQDSRFLRKELDNAKLKLDQFESQLLDVQNRTRISDPKAEEAKLIQRIGDTRIQLDQLNGQLAGTISTISAIELQLKTVPETVVESESSNQAMSARDELQQRLNQLRLEEQDLRSRFLPDSPSIQIIRNKIAEAEKLITEAKEAPGTKTTGMNPIHRELSLRLQTARSELKSLQARIMSLQGNIETADVEKQALNNATVTIERLEQNITMQREELIGYTRAFSQAEMTQNRQKFNLSAVDITQPATIPLIPVSPNRPLVLLAGLVAATLGALATALAAEGLDGSVSRPEQLQRLGVSRVGSLPVVDLKPGSYNVNATSIGSVDTSSGHTRFVRQTARPGLEVQASRAGDASMSPREVLESIQTGVPRGSMFATSGATSTVEANDTKSVSAKPGQPNNHAIARAELDATVVDSSLDLLERLVLVGGNELPRTVAIVGLQPAGGATTVAAHVAAAMTGLLREDASTENGRVLLIDGNLIESGVVNHFSNLSGDGLSQWLSDGSTAGSLARVIRRTDNSRLDVLPAGSNAKQLVGRLGDAIQAAKELGYRSVVIDLPPLSKSETAARIAGTCDATILVADYGKSNREMLRQMLSRLNESGATIAGAVLNRRQFPVPKSLYNLF